ncbi:kinase-like protein [Schizopora paradoxa]|uniref:non-specific serine/threonine protein kinase n=1 Tax=Schizopora paradoxa TaxID=27342 RepID=A0A0H2STB3_9AGAM|nr:kinase-like protein [Schizopora paradoxa]
MLHVEVQTPSPEPARPATLADLSRNASVISTSSSSSSSSSLVANTPRPRPVRTFSAPRSLSREAPSTPRASRPPAYLAREFGLANGDGDMSRRAQSRSKSRTNSRNSSVGVKAQLDDFEFGEELGEGSYSTVYHAVYRPSGREYAIKVVEKALLIRKKKEQVVLAEKSTLIRLGSGHPGVVRLHWTFHDDWSYFFVLDLARNGEMKTRISRLGSLSLPCARHYAAQVVDAVAYIHARGVIHRDLKPENLLLDDDMRIKITDFGTGKILGQEDDRAGTFVGTAQYVSPELLHTNTTSKSSDIWAVGCIIFQMIAGRFPFHAPSEYLTFEKVKKLDYSFPDGFDEDAKDLVQRILVLDPIKRLGAGEAGSDHDMNALRQHPFFKSIDWQSIWVDPAPPMEAGLVKKEHPGPGDDNYDVGAAWDELVSHEGVEDTIPWVDEENGIMEPDPYPYNYNVGGEIGPIGPLDISPMHINMVPPETHSGTSGHLFASYYADPRSRAIPSLSIGGPDDNLPTIIASSATPINIPTRHSTSTGSTTSSSEGGSPVDKLGSAMEAISLDRGRDRSTTPIQLVISPDVQWSNLLGPGEQIIFHSSVEVRSRRRRLTASLLPAQHKPKIRHLVLTSIRLLVVKVKPGRSVVLKSETFFRPVSKDKEPERKDGKIFVTDVTAKGKNGFIVMTTGKPQQYAWQETSLVEKWIAEIRNSIQSASRSSSRSRTTSLSSGSHTPLKPPL